jgi:hypothetical protein
MERKVGERLAGLIGTIFAALVIGYFSFNSVYFSPQAIRIDSLKPLPF